MYHWKNDEKLSILGIDKINLKMIYSEFRNIQTLDIIKGKSFCTPVKPVHCLTSIKDAACQSNNNIGNLTFLNITPSPPSLNTHSSPLPCQNHLHLLQYYGTYQCYLP